MFVTLTPATARKNFLRLAAESAQEAKDWTLARNGYIQQAHESGASLRAIAEAVGLSHAAVAKIVKRG